MLSRIEFLFTETFTSLRRHPAMAFAATLCVASTLFVASMAGIMWLNAHYWVDTTISRVRFDVFFQPETSSEEADATVKRLQALSGVESVEFVSKDIAWEKLKEKDPKLTREFQENPYPDMAVVKATEITYIPALVKQIKKWPEVHNVKDFSEFTANMNVLRTNVSRCGFAMGIILALLSLVIIHHTIELTLYARRKEIHIMSLVGATPTTVALPFLLEGFFYGVCGAAIALTGTFLLYRYISDSLLRLYGAHLLWESSVLTNGIITILVAGALLGLIGSIASVIKYLLNPRSKLTNA